MIVRKETVIIVNYNDLDKAISEEFGIKYESVDSEEWNNGQAKKYNIQPEPLNEYNANRLANRKLSYMTRSLLCEMCHRGKIEPGTYFVEVSW